jgi:hypothetical protein
MQLIPNAKQQFIDQNGAPLANGTVGFYAPGTLNPKTTYQDAAGTIANTNPVQLDSRGQALIWGSGVFRQIVKDCNGVTIWDQITEDSNSGLSGNITDAKFAAGADFTPGTTTSLTLPISPGASSNMWIFFDAAYQADDQYSVNGTTLTFNTPIPVGVQEVNVKIGATVAIGTPSDGTVTDAKISSGSMLYDRIYRQKTVRDYGAKGDGVTDDSAAFQAAINSGVVRIPYSANGYKINTALNATNRDFLTIEGVGNGAPQWGLAYQPPVQGSVIIANTGGYLLDITGSNNVTLRNFTISSAFQINPTMCANPSTVGIVGGTSSDNSRLGSPGGSGYYFENITVAIANVTASTPIYINNGNLGKYINVSTLGRYGFCLTMNNPLSAVPPYTSFGTLSASDGNYIAGGYFAGYGHSPVLYLEQANDLQIDQTYVVYVAGAGTSPYPGPGYAMYMKDCTDVRAKIEMDYFPYLFWMDGINVGVDISGIAYAGTTPIPSSSPGIGFFNGAQVKNCKLNVMPIGAFPNNNFHYATVSGSAPTMNSIINCDFYFDTLVSPNVAFFDLSNVNPLPFFNNTFRGNGDLTVGTTPMTFQINGAGASGSQHRTWMNGLRQGTA